MSQVHAHNVAISSASFGAREGLTLEVCYAIEAVPAPADQSAGEAACGGET